MKVKTTPFFFFLRFFAWSLAGLGLYLMVAWAGYSPYDMSWSAANLQDSVSNTAGGFGAWIMDACLTFFGRVGNLLPFLCFFVPLLWLFNAQQAPKSWWVPLRWTTGALLLLCGLTVLATAFPMSASNAPFYRSGGVLGALLAQGLMPILQNKYLFWFIGLLMTLGGFFACRGITVGQYILKMYRWVMLQNEETQESMENSPQTALKAKEPIMAEMAEEKTPVVKSTLKIRGLDNPYLQQEDFYSPEKAKEEKNHSAEIYETEKLQSAEVYETEKLHLEEQKDSETQTPSPEASLEGLANQEAELLNKTVAQENHAEQEDEQQIPLETESFTEIPVILDEKVEVKVSDEEMPTKVVSSQVQEIPVIKMVQKEQPTQHMTPQQRAQLERYKAWRKKMQAQRIQAQMEQRHEEPQKISDIPGMQSLLRTMSPEAVEEWQKERLNHPALQQAQAEQTEQSESVELNANKPESQENPLEQTQNFGANVFFATQNTSKQEEQMSQPEEKVEIEHPQAGIVKGNITEIMPWETLQAESKVDDEKHITEEPQAQVATTPSWRETQPQAQVTTTPSWRETQPQAQVATTPSWRETQPQAQVTTTPSWRETQPQAQVTPTPSCRETQPQAQVTTTPSWRETQPQGAREEKASWTQNAMPTKQEQGAMLGEKSLENVQKSAENTSSQRVLPQAVTEQAEQTPNYKGYGESLIHPALQKKMDILEKPTTPMPSVELLDEHPSHALDITPEFLQETSARIEHLLKDFGVKANVEEVLVGPVVTRYDLALQPGVKAAKITNIESDLARALMFPAIRVAEVIPGKPYVGIETPNEKRQTVFLRNVLDSDAFRKAKSPLSMALGKDISGEPVVVDLASMPHLLVAGATGSGKSVGVNTMILSLLFRVKPEEVKFIMIDPKVVELSVYNGIPHLLTEVVTDMKKAANALRWCVDEMERRYQLLAALSVRNIEGFNETVQKYNDLGMPIPNPIWKPGDTMDKMPPALEKLPYIVVIVDEFADLMMMVGKQVEELIARLAQKARAIGIHLILATQRPSVDVITGLIKANIPTRIAFSVASKIDSRTILDQSGAEALLGRGDMLYAGKNAQELTRVHGAYMTDEEVVRVANDWRARGKPNYIDGILDYADEEEDGNTTQHNDLGELDELFDEVVEFVTSSGNTSVSSIQRRFRVGFNRAARIMDQLEDQGIVSSMQNGKREILTRLVEY